MGEWPEGMWGAAWQCAWEAFIHAVPASTHAHDSTLTPPRDPATIGQCCDHEHRFIEDRKAVTILIIIIIIHSIQTVEVLTIFLE